MKKKTSDHFCPKCGQHWAVHNDDGSCVNDDELDKIVDKAFDDAEKRYDAGDHRFDFADSEWPKKKPE